MAESKLGNRALAADTAPRLRLRPYPEDRATWQRLLETFPGPTLYHSDSWIELLGRAYGFPFWLATFEQDQEIAAACVLARSHNPFAAHFISLPFSDTCAPLAADPKAANRLLDALVGQALAGTSYEIRGIRAEARWETVECFANWRLRLDRSTPVLYDALGLNFRRNVRHALRAHVKIDRGSTIDYLERFYNLQLESRRHFGIPPQPWRFFKAVREIFSPGGNFEVWIASDGEKDVASAIFLGADDAVYYKWGAHRLNDRSNANHLLMWNAVEEFVSRNHVLDLGRADVRNHGLTRFKSELGARATPLPYSFYPRAPDQVSPEVLTGTRKAMAKAWSRLPISVTRIFGSAVYRYLA